MINTPPFIPRDLEPKFKSFLNRADLLSLASTCKENRKRYHKIYLDMIGVKEACTTKLEELREKSFQERLWSGLSIWQRPVDLWTQQCNLYNAFAPDWSSKKVTRIIQNIEGDRLICVDMCRFLVWIPKKKRIEKEHSYDACAHLSNDVLLFLKAYESVDTNLIREAYLAIPNRNGDILRVLYAKACWALLTLEPRNPKATEVEKEEASAKTRRSKLLWELIEKDSHAQAIPFDIAPALELYYLFLEQLQDPNGLEDVPRGLYQSLLALEEAVRSRDVNACKRLYDDLIKSYLPRFTPTVLCMFNRLYATTSLHHTTLYPYEIDIGDIEEFFMQNTMNLQDKLNISSPLCASLLRISSAMNVYHSDNSANLNFTLLRQSEQKACCQLSVPKTK